MLQTYTEEMVPLALQDKKKVHQEGLWHKVVGALVMNETDVFLQTIYPKTSYGFQRPDYLDLSVGGHVENQETVQDALLREAKEEIGLTNFSSNFVKIRKINCDPDPNYKIREFQYLYLIHTSQKLTDFNLLSSDPEVKSIVAIPKASLLKLLTKKVTSLSVQEAVFDKETRLLVHIQERLITLNDFIPDYLNEHVFEFLLETKV